MMRILPQPVLWVVILEKSRLKENEATTKERY